MYQDLRFGMRLLRKHKGFTAVAVLSLALGIGANTAIFSLVDVVLLRLLPVKSPEQLVVIENFGQYTGPGPTNFSHPMFEQIRARTQVFSGVFAFMDGTRSRVEVAGHGFGKGTEQAEVQDVSGEYFQVLGVNAIAGRTLTVADNQTPGAHPVAVLSYRFWQRSFAGDASVIGKNITLKGHSFTIIGVTPPGFFGESLGQAPDIWVPLMMQPTLDRGHSYLSDPNTGWLRIMARLRPGISEEQAQAALTTLLGQIKSDSGNLASWISRIGLSPGGQGLSKFRNSYAKPLRVLMAVVGLVLLIACANVANLLLARATARQREVAVRLAIGAGRFRLIRQFLTESLLLAAAGGVLGLFFAWWGSSILLVLVSGDATPIPIDVTPNIRILGFTIAVSLLTAILFGLAPALIATRQNINTALKATSLARPRLSLTRPLVVAQVALSLLLLTGAGLLVKTLHNLRTMDLGFAVENVVQAHINPQGYKPEQLADLNRRMLERLNSAPGIRSASIAGSGFRTGSSTTCCIAVEGYAHRPDEDRQVQTLGVTPGYFRTMGLPLLRGRDFTPQEIEAGPGSGSRRVAIINEAMARRYFGEANPLGRRFGWGNLSQQINYDHEIVGVARDANYGDLREKARPLIYRPNQNGTLLVVRGMGSGVSLPATIRREIEAVDKSLEILAVGSLSQALDEALVQERLLAKLAGFFSLLALLLACIGLYAMMSYDVTRRTQEIGIRIALGAQAGDVLRLVLRETMLLVAIGLMIGLAAAAATTRFIESLLFGLTATDPLTIALATLLLLAVAAASGWLPARRAARVDPLVALRDE
jgi:predicted permease